MVVSIMAAAAEHLRCGGQLCDRYADDAEHEAHAQPRKRVRHKRVPIRNQLCRNAGAVMSTRKGFIVTRCGMMSAAIILNDLVSGNGKAFC